MFPHRQGGPLSLNEHEDLYFEVVAKIWGIRETSSNVVFIPKEPDRPAGPDGVAFQVVLKIFQDPAIRCLPRRMLWDLLAQECGKIWPVVTADVSRIKASLALENRQLIGGFCGSNGLVFWLWHEAEK
jgi:hypothetical protein